MNKKDDAATQSHVHPPRSSGLTPLVNRSRTFILKPTPTKAQVIKYFEPILKNSATDSWWNRLRVFKMDIPIKPRIKIGNTFLIVVNTFTVSFSDVFLELLRTVIKVMAKATTINIVVRTSLIEIAPAE